MLLLAFTSLACALRTHESSPRKLLTLRSSAGEDIAVAQLAAQLQAMVKEIETRRPKEGPGGARESVLRTRLFGLRLNRVRLTTESIAGIGVVAARDVLGNHPTL